MITCPDCGNGVLPDQPPPKSADDFMRERDNLAAILRRMIWMARKEVGDTTMKVLAGKAQELLQQYGLEGSVLRNED